MGFTAVLANVSNRWVLPNSNQHKIMAQVAKHGGMYEAEAARMFHMHQGFHCASMFDFMATYSMTDSIGHRDVGALTERGHAVLALLETGVAVNLKSMETSSEKAAKANMKTQMQTVRATYGSHKYAILNYLFDNGATKSTVVLEAIGFSQVDHLKYAGALRVAGLITMTQAGNTYMLALTKLGLEEFTEARINAPAEKKEMLTRVFLSKLKDARFWLGWASAPNYLDGILRVQTLAATKSDYMDDKRVVKALATVNTMIQEKLPNIETIIAAWLDEGSSYGVEKIIPLIEQLREGGYDISISDDLRAKIVFKVLERKGA